MAILRHTIRTVLLFSKPRRLVFTSKDFDLFNLTSVKDLQFVIELTTIQQMKSKGSFSQFEHKVFKSKLNGLIEVKSACSYFSPFS